MLKLSQKAVPPAISAQLAACVLVCAIVSVDPACAADPTPADTVAVTITDAGCSPAALSVLPGKTVFQIRNSSRRALEWEILKGVEVVEERENIIPGFVQMLTTALEPGSYLMTCGLLSNAKGTLQVTAAGATGPVGVPELVQPIADYKGYVMHETDAMLATTRDLVAAVKAGKVDEATRLYAPAHQYYERIEPIAELFNDLDSSLDARADDYERKEADPAWMGFHRLEKALFADHTTNGMGSVADKLLTDAIDLRTRLNALAITPKAMVGGAADLIEEVASKKISGEEDRYSRTDLWDFQANVDGAQKIVALLRPLIEARDPSLISRTDTNFDKVNAVLARYRTSDGFAGYGALTSTDRNALKGPVTLLAEDLSKLRGTLGVD